MSLLLVLPIAVPLSAAALSLLAWGRPGVQRVLGVTGAAALFGISVALLVLVRRRGIQAAQVAGWPAPFGITLVADTLAAVMVLLAGVVGLAVTLYSLAGVDRRREAFGYYPLVQVLLMGVCGASLTGDLFNLYVWFEVVLIASFVLLALGGERAQLEAAIKYVTLNLLSSALFLAGAGILYGAAQTLNLADLALRLPKLSQPGLTTALAMLFLVAFGIKAAAFPLFFWLPASYHTPPVAVTALFAGLLTKVGVYALIRLFTLVFVQEPGYTHTLILWIAGLTMVTGVLGAVAQVDLRRLLSFHIVSQIGYLLMGLGLLTPLGLTGSVFFLVHVVFAKSALFLVSGLAYRHGGTYDLRKLGGLSMARPLLALLFLLPALSLAGLPPLSGFFAKLALIQAGLAAGRYLVVAVAMVVSLLTLYSMMKIWTEAFWKPRPDGPVGEEERAPEEALLERTRGTQPLLLLPAAALSVLSLVLGLAAEPLLGLSSAAARQLLAPEGYIRAVLGGVP